MILRDTTDKMILKPSGGDALPPLPPPMQQPDATWQALPPPLPELVSKPTAPPPPPLDG
jgi:general secretion pathway protein D